MAEGRRPYHILYINGVAVTELHNIVALAFGAQASSVSSLDDIERSRRGAEEAMDKRVLHDIITPMEERWRVQGSIGRNQA